MTGDRDLLYAVFVQHLGYATADAVMAAGADWHERRTDGVSMRQVLVERGLLSEKQSTLVDALVTEAARQASHDVKHSLEQLTPALRDTFTNMSLSGARPRTGAGEQTAPSIDSLETEDNVGSEAPGRYRLDTGLHGRAEELGRGGVGRVVVARDRYLGRLVAMKEILRDFTSSAVVDTAQTSLIEARFLREARLTGQLEHPAIVPVYELARRRDGTLYYTMPRIKGRTFGQALKDGRTLEGRLAFVPDLLTVCRAVASAHHQGVIHRDLKPQNVMLGAFGETYVMDWGLARALGRVDPTERGMRLAPDITAGQVVGAIGTPSYMSPEQAFGSLPDIDEKSDVWGLGALLFELLTGRAPFVGTNPWEVLAQVREGKVVRPGSLEPSVPPELEAVCLKALSRDKAQRYASAAAMADDVEAWLNRRRVGAYEYRLREVARRLFQKHRLLVTSALLVVLALAGASAFSLRRVRTERDEARAFARLFLGEVMEALDGVSGTADLLQQLTVQSLDVFQRDLVVTADAPDDLRVLLKAWTTLGGVQWQSGDSASAGRAFAEAQKLAEAHLAQSGGDAVALAWYARALVGQSDVEFDEGRLDAVEASLLRARGIAERALIAAPDDVDVLAASASVESRSAFVFTTRGRRPEALVAARRSRELEEKRFALAPDDLSIRVDVTRALQNEASAAAEPRQALELYRRSVVQARELVRRSDQRRNRVVLADGLSQCGVSERRAGNAKEGAALIAEGRAQYERLLGDDPKDTSSLYMLINSMLELGAVDDARGRALELAAMNPGGEFAGAALAAAWASGHDDEVLTPTMDLGASTYDAAIYQLLVKALRGELQEAAQLARDAAGQGDRPMVFVPSVVTQRFATARPDVRTAIEAFAPRFDRAVGQGQPGQMGAALSALADALDAMPRGRKP